MEFYNALCEEYGIKPMSIEEEAKLPKFAKQTRNNKIKIMGVCTAMRRILGSVEYRTKHAPELNNEEHAALVEELKNLLNQAYETLEKTYTIGR